MKGFIVLVCGSHTYSDKEHIHSVLDGLSGPPIGDVANPTWMPRPDLVIINGAAKHVDQESTNWAIENFVTVRDYPANWDKHGKRAGPIRNQQMLDEEPVDLVIAFPGGPGTRNMVSKARSSGIAVHDLM